MTQPALPFALFRYNPLRAVWEFFAEESLAGVDPLTLGLVPFSEVSMPLGAYLDRLAQAEAELASADRAKEALENDYNRLHDHLQVLRGERDEAKAAAYRLQKERDGWKWETQLAGQEREEARAQLKRALHLLDATENAVHARAIARECPWLGEDSGDE